MCVCERPRIGAALQEQDNLRPWVKNHGCRAKVNIDRHLVGSLLDDIDPLKNMAESALKLILRISNNTNKKNCQTIAQVVHKSTGQPKFFGRENAGKCKKNFQTVC